MIAPFWILLLLSAGEAPEMTCRKVVVEYQDSDGRQATSRRTIWRHGNRMARVEERELLIVVAVPDGWRVDMRKRRGEHYDARGAGGEDRVYVPVFDAEELRDLEFGRELEFFQRHGQKTGTRSGEDRYTVESKSGSLSGMFKAGTDRPLFIRKDLFGSGYRYREHAEVPCSMTLFEKPAGVAFKEAKR